jgi:predicted peptidase
VKRWQRDTDRKAKWAARDQILLAQVNQPSVIPNRRAPLFFLNKRYIYAKPGMQFPFRYTLRSPKRGENLPLVIFLSGAMASGTSGFKPLVQKYALMFLRGVRQRDYHLFVPQEGLGDPFSDEFSETLGEVITTLPRVDKSRIYITGYSMGGCMALVECHRHPDRYAAAVAVAAWLENLQENHANPFRHPFDDAAYNRLAKTPMWLSYCETEREQNEPPVQALQARGATVQFSFLKLRGQLGHVLTPPVFSLTKPWATWLFSQRK